MKSASNEFPTETSGLTRARPTELVELADGERFDLRISPVFKKLGEATVRLLAYNGSIPGPTLRVRQGSTAIVHVVNEGDLEATVHWHGLRLENRYDGTAETQPPIAIGGSFTYRLMFPDPGVYWYHPHIREDYGQEMGLYGNIVVVPSEPDYWPPVHREVMLTLDDILLENGRVAPFRRTESTYTAMGRFGNVMLVNGEPVSVLTARKGEVVRFYMTDTANTRVFNVGLPGVRMKLVGGDSGHHEREEFVESVLLAPSERVVVDVRFAEAGQFALEHRTPGATYPLVRVVVEEDEAEPSLAAEFDRLRTNADMNAERARATSYLDAPPDRTLALVAEMHLDEPAASTGTAISYTCPMHPAVIRDEPGRCPKCFMKLRATAAPPTAYACPMHPEVRREQPGRCPKCGMKLVPAQLVRDTSPGHSPSQHGDPTPSHGDHTHQPSRHGGEHDPSHGSALEPTGIEWEDDMVDVNRMTTPANMRWKIVDRATGAEGHAIDWRFRVGDLVKIRLINEMDSDHPMHHPFHVHGAGRFLILARDGVSEANLVWKDTVLIPTGQTVDILLHVTNPGVWMAHCHIAEHHESGMMFSFTVDA